MATVTYRVINPHIVVSASSIDSTATICWNGITETSDTCYSAADESTYCENIYIGKNTDCDTAKYYSGITTWHDIPIEYEIYQSGATCCSCSSETWCELINYQVDPYYLPPYSADAVTKVYYNYWNYNKDEDCIVTRTKDSGEIEVELDTNIIPCSSDTRTITSALTIGCGDKKDFEWYVKKPDNCCNSTKECTCYDIGDIYYFPSIISHSGGNVSYYFDYKKILTKDCKQKVSFGRYEGTWDIEECNEAECCKNTRITTTLSTLTDDWNDRLMCNNNGYCSDLYAGSGVTLTVTRRRDPTRDDCINVCESETGYCVVKESIKTYHIKDDGTWKNWGHWTSSGWTYDDNYKLPFYGGNIKVTWEYNAYIIYDDCTTGMTSGNTWEDIFTAPAYSGDDCYECGVISFVSGETNTCSGGTAMFTFSGNTDDSKENIIQYSFKKSPCDLVNSVEFPKEITAETKCECNEFSIEYKQKKPLCNSGCQDNICISGNTTILVDTSGTTTSTTYNNNCNIIVISQPYWINDIKINGGTITFKVDENNSSNREGAIIFQISGKDCYETVMVEQTGVGEKGRLIVNGDICQGNEITVTPNL